jgi:hypothetical protein
MTTLAGPTPIGAGPAITASPFGGRELGVGDNHRWFKLWITAPQDDELTALPPELRWAWAVLGCHTKVHGTHGIVTVSASNAGLAAAMGLPSVHLLFDTLFILPGIYIGTAPVRWPHGHTKPPVCDGEFVRGGDPSKERGGDPPKGRGSSTLKEWGTRHGKLTVTWKNWIKYQEDSTQAQRGRASRSKRRGEEKRRESPLVPPRGPEFSLSDEGSDRPENSDRPEPPPDSVSAILARSDFAPSVDPGVDPAERPAVSREARYLEACERRRTAADNRQGKP